MTFSIAAKDKKTGMFGIAIATSAIAVGNRCPWVKAGVGAVTTQHRTDTRQDAVRWSVYLYLLWRIPTSSE